MARKAARGIVPLPARMATEAPCWQLGGSFLAQGIRGPQRHADAASTLLGRDGARRRATDGQRAGFGSDWTHHYRLWNGSAKETLHSENSERRRDLVPGL